MLIEMSRLFPCIVNSHVYFFSNHQKSSYVHYFYGTMTVVFCSASSVIGAVSCVPRNESRQLPHGSRQCAQLSQRLPEAVQWRLTDDRHQTTHLIRRAYCIEVHHWVAAITLYLAIDHFRFILQHHIYL